MLEQNNIKYPGFHENKFEQVMLLDSLLTEGGEIDIGYMELRKEELKDEFEKRIEHYMEALKNNPLVDEMANRALNKWKGKVPPLDFFMTKRTKSIALNPPDDKGLRYRWAVDNSHWRNAYEAHVESYLRKGWFDMDKGIPTKFFDNKMYCTAELNGHIIGTFALVYQDNRSDKKELPLYADYRKELDEIIKDSKKAGKEGLMEFGSYTMVGKERSNGLRLSIDSYVRRKEKLITYIQKNPKCEILNGHNTLFSSFVLLTMGYVVTHDNNSMGVLGCNPKTHGHFYEAVDIMPYKGAKKTGYRNNPDANQMLYAFDPVKNIDTVKQNSLFSPIISQIMEYGIKTYN